MDFKGFCPAFWVKVGSEMSRCGCAFSYLTFCMTLRKSLWERVAIPTLQMRKQSLGKTGGGPRVWQLVSGGAEAGIPALGWLPAHQTNCSFMTLGSQPLFFCVCCVLSVCADNEENLFHPVLLEKVPFSGSRLARITAPFLGFHFSLHLTAETQVWSIVTFDQEF